ncbi:MAG: hypothetical protein WD772_10810 [Pseudohongiellaceae bacterium]
MNETTIFFTAWLVYLAAGTIFYALYWKATGSTKHVFLSYNARAIMLALIATPWFTGIEGRELAPALMVVMMDAITVSGEAAVRAFIPLLLSLLLSLMAGTILAFLRFRSRLAPGNSVD